MDQWKAMESVHGTGTGHGWWRLSSSSSSSSEGTMVDLGPDPPSHLPLSDDHRLGIWLYNRCVPSHPRRRPHPPTPPLRCARNLKNPSGSSKKTVSSQLPTPLPSSDETRSVETNKPRVSHPSLPPTHSHHERGDVRWSWRRRPHIHRPTERSTGRSFL